MFEDEEEEVEEVSGNQLSHRARQPTSRKRNRDEYDTDLDSHPYVPLRTTVSLARGESRLLNSYPTEKPHQRFLFRALVHRANGMCAVVYVDGVQICGYVGINALEDM